METAIMSLPVLQVALIAVAAISGYFLQAWREKFKYQSFVRERACINLYGDRLRLFLWPLYFYLEQIVMIGAQFSDKELIAVNRAIYNVLQKNMHLAGEQDTTERTVEYIREFNTWRFSGKPVSEFPFIAADTYLRHVQKRLCEVQERYNELIGVMAEQPALSKTRHSRRYMRQLELARQRTAIAGTVGGNDVTLGSYNLEEELPTVSASSQAQFFIPRVRNIHASVEAAEEEALGQTTMLTVPRLPLDPDGMRTIEDDGETPRIPFGEPMRTFPHGCGHQDETEITRAIEELRVVIVERQPGEAMDQDREDPILRNVEEGENADN